VFLLFRASAINSVLPCFRDVLLPRLRDIIVPSFRDGVSSEKASLIKRRQPDLSKIASGPRLACGFLREYANSSLKSVHRFRWQTYCYRAAIGNRIHLFEATHCANLRHPVGSVRMHH
jgi:hypothetical protein